VDNTIQDGDESEEQRIDKLVEKKILQREKHYEEQRRRQEEQETPQKLQTAFNDFNQVCTTENLDYLEYHYPEVAVGYKHMPESFEKWAAIYKSIKRFIPNTESKKDSKKADQNMVKPRSMSSPTVSPGGEGKSPNVLTEERRAANWERMQRLLKSVN
jgi:hypothetical protein